MASKMVDVTINRLLSVKEMFAKLEANIMSKILTSSLKDVIYGGSTPTFILEHYMKKISEDVIQNIEKIVNIRTIVIKGMTAKPTTLGSFFQKVGSKELKFLVDSGTYMGFMLGLVQMVQWMLFPYNWTLPIGKNVDVVLCSF